MRKEEIMDIDEEPLSEVNVHGQSIDSRQNKAKDFKYKLLERLESDTNNNSNDDPTKNLTLAITIQTMFNKDPEVLERLFRFFIEKKQFEMALDLWENDLLKRFNLDNEASFDIHMQSIATQIIKHLSVNRTVQSNTTANISEKDSLTTAAADVPYLELFLKMSQTSQEKLVIQLLNKYRNGFSFLRVPDAAASKKAEPVELEIREFYTKLVEVKDTIFMTKNLLTIYRQFIPEYGIFLIDGFLNIEKTMFANLIQNSSNLPKQADQILSNIEKRSLNVIRRICVVDLIPEFIYLIDKLDNRHCYRWIEKSLEFYTKYTLNAIEAKLVRREPSSDSESSMSVKLDYLNVRLLNDFELSAMNESEEEFNKRIEFLNSNLKGLVDYKYYNPKFTASHQDNSSPFQHIYKLLDEISKKLDWPTLPAPNTTLQNGASFCDVDNKLSYLLSLKSKLASETTKPPAASNISVSSLNKQISFYGIALFFHKLIEFNALADKFFSNRLTLTRKFDAVVKRKFIENLQASKLLDKEDKFCNDPIDYAICTLVYCLKLWQKFNCYKEFSTIVTKCLSNSKLDSLTCYKNFLNEYYSVYSSTLNAESAPSSSSSSLTPWDPLLVEMQQINSDSGFKQSVSLIVNLFIQNTAGFEIFFEQFVLLLSKLTDRHSSSSSSSHYISSSQVILSNSQFDIFELNLVNTIEYFSRLIIEKLYHLFITKKSNLIKFFNENDTLLGHLIMIIQINLSENAPSYLLEIYDFIFQIVKTKDSFVYADFYEYIYDIQVLQDFITLVLASEKVSSWQLTKENISHSIDDIKTKFNSQVNHNTLATNRHSLLYSFYKKNYDDLGEFFNKIFQL